MDSEVRGKHAKVLSVKSKDKIPANEKGDVFKQSHVPTERPKEKTFNFPQFSEKPTTSRTKSKTELTHKEVMSQECTQRQTERLEELKRERGQADENAEVLGIPLPFRSIGERSSLTDLHNLLEQCPQPQPPLINKQLKTLQLNANQAVIMAEQVKKMKSGMERLQEIIKKFNCTERFKQDIDFIIANVGPAIAKAEQMRQSDQLLYKLRTKENPPKST